MSRKKVLVLREQIVVPISRCDIMLYKISLETSNKPYFGVAVVVMMR
jgi:hypothetical protein